MYVNVLLVTSSFIAHITFPYSIRSSNSYNSQTEITLSLTKLLTQAITQMKIYSTYLFLPDQLHL